MGPPCTFCYRQCSEGGGGTTGDLNGERNRNDVDLIFKKFGCLVEKYLGNHFPLFGNELVLVDTCEDCLVLMKSFCDMYHELKCLEMKLEWRLGKLRDVMSAADKVRSRKIAFRAGFTDVSNNVEDEKRIFKLVTKHRKDFKRNCNAHDAKSFPKVLLRRLPEPETVKDVDGDIKATGELYHLLFLWVSTFAVVLMLGNPTEQLATNSQLDQKFCVDEQDMDEFFNGANEFESKSIATQQRTQRQQMNTTTLKQKRKHPRKFHKPKRVFKVNTNRVFDCHCCNRKFNSLKSFQLHRKAFTHLLMKKKCIQKLKPQKKLKTSRINSRNPIPETLNQEVDNVISSVGILRPLPKISRWRVVVDESGSSDKDVQDDNDDDDNDDQGLDKNFTENSDISSSSSSSSSDDESETEISLENKRERDNDREALKLKLIKNKVQVCEIDSCSERFTFPEELQNHKKLHASFPCNFCDEVVNYAPLLALHEIEHTAKLKREAGKYHKKYNEAGKLIYYCPRCNYSISNRLNYIEHYLKTHLNLPQPAKCPICMTWISRSWNLEAHISKCHGDGNVDLDTTHKCDQCSAYFVYKSTLNSHKKAQHSHIKKEKNFHCNVDSCSEAFVTENELIAHERLHGNFSCKFCSVVENYAPNLSLHEMSHRNQGTGVQSKYMCARCSFGTNLRQEFIRHHAIVHLQLSFSTNICSVCKAQYSVKKSHFRTHHDTAGVAPESVKKCRDCSAYFLTRKQLLIHKKVIHHQTEKLSDAEISSDDEDIQDNNDAVPKNVHVCGVNSCPKHFVFEEELTIHKKRHGNFPCQFCKVVKTYAPNLATHELKAHKQLLDNKGKRCPRCDFKVKNPIKGLYVDHFLNKHLLLPVQRFMCQFCKVFLVKRGLKGHYRTFHDTSELSDPTSIEKCDKCPAYFLKSSQLQNHIKQVHIQENRELLLSNRNRDRAILIRCDKPGCSKRFETNDDYENHSKLHGSFTCSLCPFVESYAPILPFHEKTHLSSPSSSSSSAAAEQKNLAILHSCSRCTRTFNGRFQFVTHFLEDHMSLPFEGVTCQICKDKFPNLGKVGTHFNRMHNTLGMQEGEIARCDQCPAYFRKRVTLLNHKKKLHGEDPLTCVDCAKKFNNPRHLRAHRKNKHRTKESDFQFACNFVPNCNRRYETKTELEWHQQMMHNSNKAHDFNPIICEVCGKTCLGKNGFLVHMKMHRSSSTGAAADLKRKEPKTFVCDQCGKVFSCIQSLQNHQFSHMDPSKWKYSCIFCEKKSQSMGSLYIHLQAHTGEKPWICEECGVEYAHGRDLRSHRNKNHGANDLPKKRKVINGRVSKKGQKLPRLKKRK